MCNVFDVAKYILREIGEVSTMKLQKLCYYSLVESIKVNSQKPLFNESFEAWANGPVCRDLFNVHKGKFTISQSNIPNNLLSNSLSLDDMNIINKVIEHYGKFSGAELSTMSHKETPWKKAREGYSPAESCRIKIKVADIKEYYLN